MKGIITIKCKEGSVFQGNIWVFLPLVIKTNGFIQKEEILELSIDGELIPKPESAEDGI